MSFFRSLGPSIFLASWLGSAWLAAALSQTQTRNKPPSAEWWGLAISLGQSGGILALDNSCGKHMESLNVLEPRVF